MLTVKNVPQNDMLSLVRGAQTFEDLRAVLVWIRNKFSITNVTYHAIKMPNCSVMHPLTISTYKQEWISHYVEKKYFRVDPVINYGFHSFLPFDWSALDCNSTATRDFFLTPTVFLSAAKAPQFRSAAQQMDERFSQ
jgi:hypothetical protein